jgi:ABC-2 type transport system permease protein
MRKYLGLMIRGFDKHITYRAAVVGGLFTNITFGALRSAIMLAVFASSAKVGGYNVYQAVAYVWVVQGLLTVVQVYGNTEFAQRIRTGDIVIDLARPIDVQLAYFAEDFGRLTYHLLFRGIIPVVFGALAFEIAMPGSALSWIAFLASVLLAAAVSFMLRFLYSALVFWLFDYRGINLVVVVLLNVLSGFVIPVSFFPHWLKVIAFWTPFPSIVQSPVDIFVGRLTNWAAIETLGYQAAWVVGLCLLGRFVFEQGRKRFLVQGG